MKLYSPSKNMFFAAEHQATYEAAGTWPKDIREVDDDVYAALVGKAMQPDASGNPIVAIALPTTEELVADKCRFVQEFMDKKAKSLGYDDIKTAVTYADEPAVWRFQAEGQALRAWRSKVWARCYDILDEFNRGLRGVPADDELIVLLPEFEMPG